jgi:hypothetical protein
MVRKGNSARSEKANSYPQYTEHIRRCLTQARIISKWGTGGGYIRPWERKEDIVQEEEK